MGVSYASLGAGWMIRPFFFPYCLSRGKEREGERWLVQISQIHRRNRSIEAAASVEAFDPKKKEEGTGWVGFWVRYGV